MVIAYTYIFFYSFITDPVHDDHIIILQYANQGNLREYLEKDFLSLHWKDKSQMALDITCGLKYLHSRQIIHRDLVIHFTILSKFIILSIINDIYFYSMLKIY